ncbi:CDGSH iron-sulfur domain-containing protein 3, mitochondrial [Aplysia californica]|uniref:CDGSH iron-sulfur domain-containing protein 3, mitochondrial n=1 Tax=Aplysia californica TaxID=6500 RepID=A0ABM0JNX0_APLCA|nr:CDGSH iron-sulfur domain-containing protein 3, mitochondrial [Aplysia californica]
MAAALRGGSSKGTRRLFQLSQAHPGRSHLAVGAAWASKHGPDDPRDPKFAKWTEKPHIETPKKHSLELYSREPVKGKVFEKLPFRVKLEAGKTYSFCTCGYSKQQPFCDTSHKAPNFISTRPHHIRYRPLPFKVDETKEYWLCMCKQSNKRPFCDGSHKRLEIQNAVRS